MLTPTPLYVTSLTPSASRDLCSWKKGPASSSPVLPDVTSNNGQRNLSSSPLSEFPQYSVFSGITVLGGHVVVCSSLMEHRHSGSAKLPLAGPATAPSFSGPLELSLDPLPRAQQSLKRRLMTPEPNYSGASRPRTHQPGERGRRRRLNTCVRYRRPWTLPRGSAV